MFPLPEDALCPLSEAGVVEDSAKPDQIDHDNDHYDHHVIISSTVGSVCGVLAAATCALPGNKAERETAGTTRSRSRSRSRSRTHNRDTHSPFPVASGGAIQPPKPLPEPRLLTPDS